MKKKLACMLLMGTLALSMAACGNGQDKNTGAATETGVESTEGTAESTGTSVESTEAGNAGTQQEMEMWHRHYRAPKSSDRRAG